MYESQSYCFRKKCPESMSKTMKFDIQMTGDKLLWTLDIAIWKLLLCHTLNLLKKLCKNSDVIFYRPSPNIRGGRPAPRKVEPSRRPAQARQAPSRQQDRARPSAPSYGNYDKGRDNKVNKEKKKVCHTPRLSWSFKKKNDFWNL